MTQEDIVFILIVIAFAYWLNAMLRSMVRKSAAGCSGGCGKGCGSRLNQPEPEQAESKQRIRLPMA